MDAIDIVNAVGSGSMATGSAIAAGPAGSMLYVGLGGLFILTVAGLVITFIHSLRK